MNSSSANSCPNGWTGFCNYCYRVFGTVTSWDDAQSYCENLGSGLVTIDSREENELVRSLLDSEPSLTRIWIGLRQRLYWYDSSEPSYTNWGSGEPNGQGSEPCGSLNKDGYWNDVPCQSVSTIGIGCKMPAT